MKSVKLLPPPPTRVLLPSNLNSSKYLLDYPIPQPIPNLLYIFEVVFSYLELKIRSCDKRLNE